MIQRLLHTVLTNGLADIAADPEILDDIFGSRGYGLSATEIAAIKTLFAAKPPTVVHGYAREEHDFPLYAIILGNEGEDEHFIGDDAGMIDDPEDPDFGADCLSAIWKHTYHIHCYSEHPDVTTYIYEVAKSVILVREPDFQAEGLYSIHVSGMDLAPDPRYIPEHLFVRQLTFDCKREFLRVLRSSAAGKAFKVGKIHIDNPDSSGDITGVQAGVTPVTED